MRFAILAEQSFGPQSSKTASACIRYTPERVVAVIDSALAGRTAQDVLDFGGDIPVVATLEDALRRRPTALLVGIAPPGGQLPEAWRGMLRRAIEAGLEIWSGLHFFISDDAELAALAAERGVAIRDLRRPPAKLDVARGRVRDVDGTNTVVLTVGSDCNIGKMTTQLQLRDAMRRAGHDVVFAATGQTGILVEGWGIAVDAVIADFIAGASEQLTLEGARKGEIVLVEGQGSIIHPSYSGVTYGLLHGALPHGLLLCTQPSRTAINHNAWVKIPPLRELVDLHERVTAPLRRAPVIGIALNTFDLDDRAAADAVKRAEDETGLPATDPVRYDPTPLVEAVARFHASRRVAPRRAESMTGA